MKFFFWRQNKSLLTTKKRLILILPLQKWKVSKENGSDGKSPWNSVWTLGKENHVKEYAIQESLGSTKIWRCEHITKQEKSSTLDQRSLCFGHSTQKSKKLHGTLFELFPDEIFAHKKLNWCLYLERRFSCNVLLFLLLLMCFQRPQLWNCFMTRKWSQTSMEKH